MFTIAIRLDPETRSKLERLTLATGQTRGFLVAEAVRRFVDSELAKLTLEAKQDQAGQDQQGQAGHPDSTPARWNIIV